MRMLNRFWSGLEALPGLASILLDWREAWREEMEIGQSFLRPTRELATTYPCPSPGGDGCPRGVVVHGEQDIVAVCRSNPRLCDTVRLTKAEIVIYELDRGALGGAVASALNLIAPSKSAEAALPCTALLGWNSLTGGRRIAIYWTIQHDPQAFHATLSRLLGDADLPFILAAPTGEMCGTDSTDLLRRMRVRFLPLDECLAWEDGRGLVPTERANALLNELAVVAAEPAPKVPGGSPRTLWLDPEGSLCYFHGAQVNLSKMPFDLLELLAREAGKGKRWVSRNRISEACWPEEWAKGNPATEDQINNVASELRKALRKHGSIPAREARLLVQSKSKNGYRLNLPAHEIEIAGD